jgi:hypothetical protein
MERLTKLKQIRQMANKETCSFWACLSHICDDLIHAIEIFESRNTEQFKYGTQLINSAHDYLEEADELGHSPYQATITDFVSESIQYLINLSCKSQDEPDIIFSRN